jgi:hypothetical protein
MRCPSIHKKEQYGKRHKKRSRRGLKEKAKYLKDLFAFEDLFKLQYCGNGAMVQWQTL